jgi:hypothetical protein
MLACPHDSIGLLVLIDSLNLTNVFATNVQVFFHVVKCKQERRQQLEQQHQAQNSQ